MGKIDATVVKPLNHGLRSVVRVEKELESPVWGWRQMGVRSSPSGDATCLSRCARLRVDVCVRGRIARGYRDDDCAQPGSGTNDDAALASATTATTTATSDPDVRATPAAATTSAATTSAGCVFQAACQAAPSARRPPAFEGEEEDGGGARRDECRTASPA
jgi:hypothetical protein